MSADLIAAHRDLEKLMPNLQLPVQSGSDPILAAMNRQHTADDYRRLIERVRDARPDIALSSDFIVGFPGESEEDFAQTLSLAREIGFAQSYSFKYSPRPGTPGAAMENQIADEVKSERLARLQELLLEQQRAYNRSFIGNRLPVLLEKPGRQEGQLAGRSPYLQAVHIEAAAHAHEIGEIIEAEIVSAQTVALAGRLPVRAMAAE
jgi:tRNA-2-methylthio-N6-dimethylallyladenosine synthase